MKSIEKAHYRCHLYYEPLFLRLAGTESTGGIQANRPYCLKPSHVILGIDESVSARLGVSEELSFASNDRYASLVHRNESHYQD